MNNRKLHYLALAGTFFLGAILRLGNLEGKFLWLDEVITAIFSLGRNYNNVPLEVVIPFDQLQQIFTFQPEVNCTQIAQNIAIQSTHPPLFFCLLHTWFGWVNPLSPSWVWTLRSFSVLWGATEVAAIYLLNTKAFSPSAGLMAAVMMAVSPFGVYLSQEARHYTLPVLLITLALLGLILIQQDIVNNVNKRLRASIWIFWTTVNIIGLYVHYFFILAIVAEIVTLLSVMYRHQRNLLRYSIALILAILAIIVSYIPWFPILIGHFTRPETSWIPTPHNVAPIYQIFATWLLTIATFPVENQPLAITILSGLGTLVFGSGVLWLSFKGIKQLWKSTNLSTFTLASFTIVVLLEFLAIVYFLGKDITITPRYNFVYYPAFLALVAAGLNKNLERPQTFSLIFLGSLLSCLFVISNLAFQKPYNPQQVAQNINHEPSIPLMVVIGYRDYQNVALGLSFALALEKVRDLGDFVFLERSPSGYESVWQKLAVLPPLKAPLLNLWVIAPDLRQREYPQQLALSKHSCFIDSEHHYRIGVPYQLYRCKE